MSWTTAKITAGSSRMAKAKVPRQARKAPLLSLRLRRKFQVAWAKAEEMTRRKATRLIGAAIVSDRCLRPVVGQHRAEGTRTTFRHRHCLGGVWCAAGRRV